MNEIPLYNDSSGGDWPSEFLGFTMMQNRMAIPAWSYAFELVRPKTVVELGTHEGGFSILLAIACKNYGAKFITFDRGLYDPKWKDWFTALQVDFRRREDFLDVVVQREIDWLIKGTGTSILLCDGNDKPREFKTFAKYLKPGDIIAAHDCMEDGTNYWKSCEMRAAYVSDVCLDENLEPWNQEIFERAAWLVRRKI